AQKAFQHVAIYDTAIAEYLRQDAHGFPEEMTIAMNKRYSLRYGENPHQQAAFYADVSPGVLVSHSVTWARQLHGKELSYNNILDLDSALGAVGDFSGPTVCVVKHNNPCGLATHERLAEAYKRALAGDPVSAFGGIVACNVAVDLETAEALAPTFYEAVIAPEFAPAALERLKRKRDLRILATGPAVTPSPNARYLDLRRVRGGFLVQTPDAYPDDGIELKPVTKRSPTPAEVADLRYAWKVVKHIKSNAIVLARDRALLGMGAGQPNRVTSVKLAVERAGERAQGSVLASDAFFPFPDGVEAAAAAGVTAIIQPGGSIRDGEIIAAADKAGMAMVLTGVRHFKH
ncbi:MAG: bifunctional phosphoribosylaminoimidazolecarboxamide formyltransferase/IMP cyclohydrolase, partial [Chloroflexi bacterium]|nr:bifunctional phosphoribosylaminoimidazolecarboxamide formyltransferase/IMP cyclohydrolase [Chloroflexota bacterium]